MDQSMNQDSIEEELLQLVKLGFKEYFQSSTEFVADETSGSDLASRFSPQLEDASCVELTSCEFMRGRVNDEVSDNELTGELDLRGKFVGDVGESLSKHNVSTEFCVRIWGAPPFLSGRTHQVVFFSSENVLRLKLAGRIPHEASEQIADSISKRLLLRTLQT
jgi:hypothetical protein